MIITEYYSCLLITMLMQYRLINDDRYPVSSPHSSKNRFSYLHNAAIRLISLLIVLMISVVIQSFYHCLEIWLVYTILSLFSRSLSPSLPLILNSHRLLLLFLVIDIFKLKRIHNSRYGIRN